MIQLQNKRFQVVLWISDDRKGAEPALRLECDTLAEAEAAFREQQQSGTYRSGILMEWHKHAGSWDLLASFPE